MSDTVDTIRRLNDQLRCDHRGGRLHITQGVLAKGGRFLSALDDALTKLAFTNDDDPYHEHDFGSLVIEGTTIFFKIDYYDLDGRGASPDPSDESVTLRVMTLLLAEEY